MCYSAQIVANYRTYVRLFGAQISLSEFVDLFWRRAREAQAFDAPKALEDAFSQGDSPQEREVWALIQEHRTRSITETEQLLFAQRARLAEAERKLAVKTTKAATESRRIALSKIDWCMARLGDLRRVGDQKRDDARIFPNWYAPVVAEVAGVRVVQPMRYHCLPAGRPERFDREYPGTFNARRDSLEGYWKGVFGVTHGVALIEGFYENVSRPGPDGKPQNVVLEFRPRDGRPMAIACLWSRWSVPGKPDLLSWAAITDEPPLEVAAAGHDRCVIPLRAENIDAWLRPDPKNLAAAYALLDDRERPYYEHQLAA
ncbi:MAG: SOS response-associated peptidase family protein [Rubrivivax sp.]|nr:SOS response-associated peptidase family protein [Rubrivivax sp.]